MTAVWQVAMLIGAISHPVDGPAVDIATWTHSLGRDALSALDGQDGLRAAFSFARPEQAEPVFITRRLDPAPIRRSVAAVVFRYRLQVTAPAGAVTVPLDPMSGFRVRLRTSPTTFTDYAVPRPAGGYQVDRWAAVRLDTAFGPNVRNIYRELFENPNVIELTFRLDDGTGAESSGFIELADMALELEDTAVDQPYTPQPAERPIDGVLDVLAIRQSMDGWYDIARAAALAGAANVTEGLFRGLHFPIFEIPATRDEVLKQDVIFLGDVDPYVLTTEQIHWISDAVHSGTGLFVAAGPNSFGEAKRQPAALLDLLPVTWSPDATPVAVNALPAPLDGLGIVRRIVPVTPRDGAAVLAAAGDHPLLVSGRAGAGRVLVLTSWAQPSRLGDGSFMTTAAWPRYVAQWLNELAGRPAERLAIDPAVPPAMDVAWRYGHRTLAPGCPFGLQLTAAARRPVELRLATPAGVLWSWSGEVGPEPVMAEGVCPPVALGGPQPVSVLLDGQPVDALAGVVVEPLNRDGFYPIISYLPVAEGGHSLDADGVEAMVQELHDHGFNAIAVSGFGNHATAQLASELRGLAEQAAAARGMAVILEYTNATGLRREHPYEVSPFSPEFEPWLAKRLAAGFEQTRSMPRLLSIKLTDEPTLAPANLPRDQATLAAAQRLTGSAVLDPEAANLPGQRWAYGKLASALLEQDFATVRKLADRAGVPWDLCVTYYSPGFGGTAPSQGMEDAWHWTKPAQRFDFDVYPYFYPKSAKIRFVEADWGFAASRAMSRALDKPWGFYVELDDRNWPFQQNPAEATAECAYTAVAAGADYLNSFIHRGFGTGQMARPERWAMAGRALREIREVGALLTSLPRQAARVAVLWPETENWCYDGYAQPLYTRALLAQALGDCDVIHEAVLTTGLPSTLDILALVGVEALSADAAGALQTWVRAGGTVWCDGLPRHDEHGGALNWDGGWGDGAVMVDEQLSEAGLRGWVEGEDATAWPSALGQLAAQLGPRLKPRRELFSIRLTSDAQTGEVGIRHDGKTSLVMFVNHAAEPRTMTVELRDGPFQPKSARLVPGDEPVAVEHVNGAAKLTVVVPARWGRMVVLR